MELCSDNNNSTFMNQNHNKLALGLKWTSKLTKIDAVLSKLQKADISAIYEKDFFGIEDIQLCGMYVRLIKRYNAAHCSNGVILRKTKLMNKISKLERRILTDFHSSSINRKPKIPQGSFEDIYSFKLPVNKIS